MNMPSNTVSPLTTWTLVISLYLLLETEFEQNISTKNVEQNQLYNFGNYFLLEFSIFSELLIKLFRGAINVWPVPVSTPATDATSFRGAWTRCNCS